MSKQKVKQIHDSDNVMVYEVDKKSGKFLVMYYPDEKNPFSPSNCEVYWRSGIVEIASYKSEWEDAVEAAEDYFYMH
jgi:hypothetical protein